MKVTFERNWYNYEEKWVLCEIEDLIEDEVVNGWRYGDEDV